MGATNDEISEAAGFVVIAPGADGGGGGGGIPGGGGGSGGGGMPTTAGGGTPGGSGGGGRKGGGGLFMILIFIQHFLSILKCSSWSNQLLLRSSIRHGRPVFALEVGIPTPLSLVSCMD